MGEISRLLNNEGAFTTLQGNQRGITAFYASSFACSWVPDIGSQRENGGFMSAYTLAHARTHSGHKVAFTVAVLILSG